MSKEDKFHNLFHRGQQTCGVAAHNINDRKIRRDQIGGTCMMAVGRLASPVIESGSNLMGLGQWCWIRIGGGGKNTHVVTAYQPTNPWRKTRDETIWDQHLRYLKARGEICNPCDMFPTNLITLLHQWKDAGDEIVLLGDFNKNV
jgi:hypothetical protein